MIITLSQLKLKKIINKGITFRFISTLRNSQGFSVEKKLGKIFKLAFGQELEQKGKEEVLSSCLNAEPICIVHSEKMRQNML